MTLNKFLVLLGFLFVISLCVIVMQMFKINRLASDAEVRKKDLIRLQKQSQTSIDSIQVLQQALQEKQVYWKILYQERGDSLYKAQQQSTQWRTKYAKLKNTPAPLWTMPELDSIKRAILYTDH